MNTKADSHMNRIFTTIVNVVNLPKMSIDRIDDKNVFVVQHEQQFVPDFKFVWCSAGYYRVYILVAGSSHNKRPTGYAICTIGSGLTASGFCVLYAFLHKNRAMNKES